MIETTHQPRNRWRQEQGAEGKPPIKRLLDLQHALHAEERVAAEFEEVVVPADPLYPELFGEDSREGLLALALGGASPPAV